MKRPIFARMYTRVRPAMDQQGATEHRRRLLAGTAGQVVEVGAGDGGNFAHYPPEVVHMLAVEPEPYLQAQARRQAATAPVPVEARRVLRPSGELRFYEHVAADGGRLETVQRVADATLWPLFVGGCHVHRDTAAAITAAGFVIEELDRFDFPPDQASPARPHILGRARR